MKKKILSLVLCVAILASLASMAYAIQSIPVTGIALDKTSLSMNIGDVYTFKIKLTPENTTQKVLNYATSNKNIVTINAAGQIAAVGAGNATITVTSSSNSKLQAKCTITVSKPKPVTIKMFVSDINCPVPAVSDTMEIPLAKYLGEKTNVILNLVMLPHSKYQDTARMKFASGDLPDVYSAWAIGQESCLANGLVEPLNDLLDKYGAELKKNIPQSAWNAVTVNGQAVAIPCPAQMNSSTANLLFVRGDWMSKASVKSVPQTSDQLLDMWRAFKKYDCNGNGLKDEIPFSARASFSWMTNIFGMWGVNIENSAYQYIYGNLVPSFINPNTKKALEFLATAYKEGLLDSEFLTNSGTIWENKLLTNKVGSWNHTAYGAVNPPDGGFVGKLKNADPAKDAKLTAIPTPRGAGYTGKDLGCFQSPIATSKFIFKNAKPEVKAAAVKMFNWLATPEGSTYSHWGIEGYTYTKDPATGKVIFDRQKTIDEKVIWYAIDFNISEQPAVYRELKRSNPYEEVLMDQVLDIASKEGILNVAAPMAIPQTLSTHPDLMGSGTMIQEMMAQIVTGKKPVSYFDEVVAKWRAAGGNDAIKEATAWYKSNNAK